MKIKNVAEKIFEITLAITMWAMALIMALYMMGVDLI